MKARLFRSDAMVERLGEAEDTIVDLGDSGQLTYNALRDMEGDTVAFYDHVLDVWVSQKNEVFYSDVVLYIE